MVGQICISNFVLFIFMLSKGGLQDVMTRPECDNIEPGFAKTSRTKGRILFGTKYRFKTMGMMPG